MMIGIVTMGWPGPCCSQPNAARLPLGGPAPRDAAGLLELKSAAKAWQSRSRSGAGKIPAIAKRKRCGKFMALKHAMHHPLVAGSKRESKAMTRIFQKAVSSFRLHVLDVLYSRLRVLCFGLAGMRIGKGTILGRLRTVWPHQVSVGSKCIFEDDVVLTFDGLWQPGFAIQFGDGCFIGRRAEFNIRKGIIVGHRCAIASGCKFVDHDHGITGERIDEQPGPEKEIIIGNDVWLGANVIVLKGITIGNSAVVGAGSVVTKSIPEREVWAGVPARRIGSRK
jgi:acetyltransferase-like isoleucine patch superfamily enzyme